MSSHAPVISWQLSDIISQREDFFPLCSTTRYGPLCFTRQCPSTTQPFTTEESGGPRDLPIRGSGVGEEEGDQMPRCNAFSGSQPSWDTSRSGCPKHGQKLGEGFKKLPGMYQITKFLVYLLRTRTCAGNCRHKDDGDVPEGKSLSGSSKGQDILKTTCGLQLRARSSATAHAWTHGWGHQGKTTAGVRPAEGDFW